MNLHVPTQRQPALGRQPATTQGAEGLPRRQWTLDEIEYLTELGIFGGVDRERERFELIDGEIVPMSAKGSWHENVKRALNRFWMKTIPPELDALTETTLRNRPHNFREPDFVFWPSAVSVADLLPAHVQLLVEVSDSSLNYDLGRNATYYASLGIPDYWVIDARRLVTHIHRTPGEAGYAAKTDLPHTAFLTPLLIPPLAVRLGDLGHLPATD